MSYNGFHNTWGYPKDTTYHGMKQYVTLAVENMNCGCCNQGCNCKDKESEPEKVEEPTTTVPDNAGQDSGTCSGNPLENYIDNTSIDEPSDFAKPCDKDKVTEVTERDKTEPLCTNECMSHTTADTHIDNIMKQFKNLDENDPCPFEPKK